MASFEGSWQLFLALSHDKVTFGENKLPVLAADPGPALFCVVASGIDIAAQANQPQPTALIAKIALAPKFGTTTIPELQTRSIPPSRRQTVKMVSNLENPNHPRSLRNSMHWGISPAQFAGIGGAGFWIELGMVEKHTGQG